MWSNQWHDYIGTSTDFEWLLINEHGSHPIYKLYGMDKAHTQEIWVTLNNSKS